MITEKQKCIAEQAIYGDLYFNECSFPIRSISSIDVYLPMDMVMDIDMVKLTLRPLTDLTKEITHKGYNDDKPFIPLFEAVKNIFCYPIVLISSSENIIKVQCICPEKFIHEINRYEVVRQATKETYDLLHLLHFDTRGLIEQGEAIDVNSLPKNPYEVW